MNNKDDEGVVRGAVRDQLAACPKNLLSHLIRPKILLANKFNLTAASQHPGPLRPGGCVLSLRWMPGRRVFGCGRMRIQKSGHFNQKFEACEP